MILTQRKEYSANRKLKNGTFDLFWLFSLLRGDRISKKLCMLYIMIILVPTFMDDAIFIYFIQTERYLLRASYVQVLCYQMWVCQNRGNFLSEAQITETLTHQQTLPSITGCLLLSLRCCHCNCLSFSLIKITYPVLPFLVRKAIQTRLNATVLMLLLSHSYKHVNLIHEKGILNSSKPNTHYFRYMDL